MMHLQRSSLHLAASVIALWFCGIFTTSSGRAQTIIDPIITTAPSGVYIDTDGVVRAQQAGSADLAAMKARLSKAAAITKNEKLCFVSLPKLLAEVKALTEAGKTIPDEMRYLGGMTQLRYVLVSADDKDLVIAGPAEPWTVLGPVDVVGKLSGRPVLQLDDLIIAMRTFTSGRPSQAFGCSIDPPDDAMQRSQEVMRKFVKAPLNVKIDEMARAIGPQKVSVFGTQADTRFAFVCVAADYKLKRYTQGVEPLPVEGIGHAVDSSRAASNRFWFEASYEPLLVTAQKDAYEVRGQRLQLKCGSFSFDPKGATPKAQNFAKLFTTKFPQLATAIPLFADLQNVADLSLLANLVRHDKLAARVGWDTSWLMNAKACRVATVPVAKTAETVVEYTAGSIVAGGVSLSFATCVDNDARQVDEKKTLATVQEKQAKLKASGRSGAILHVE